MLSHVTVSKFFSHLDNCIFQLPFVLHLCNWKSNSGFTSQCLACSGGNISQVLDLNTWNKESSLYLLSKQSISMRSRQSAEYPFHSLWLVCKRDCHINYTIMVKALKAIKNAVAGEFSVRSVAGSIFFNWAWVFSWSSARSYMLP